MQLQDSKHNPKFYPKNGIKNQKFEIELLFKGSITRSEIKKKVKVTRFLHMVSSK
jgi:hypothetical protein